MDVYTHKHTNTSLNGIFLLVLTMFPKHTHMCVRTHIQTNTPPHTHTRLNGIILLVLTMLPTRTIVYQKSEYSTRND